MLTANLFTISPATPSPGIPPTLMMFCVLTMSVVAVALFVFLRYQVLRLTSEAATREQTISKFASELEAQTLLSRQMSADLDELRKRLLNQEDRSPSAASAWPSSGAPMNLNRRGQILRLSRKGKSVAEIASDLHVAQGEVELLLKVHDLSQNNPSPEK